MVTEAVLPPNPITVAVRSHRMMGAHISEFVHEEQSLSKFFW
jgi:hypothetical protein